MPEVMAMELKMKEKKKKNEKTMTKKEKKTRTKKGKKTRTQKVKPVHQFLERKRRLALHQDRRHTQTQTHCWVTHVQERT
jgi:hypothetical protein